MMAHYAEDLREVCEVAASGTSQAAVPSSALAATGLNGVTVIWLMVIAATLLLAGVWLLWRARRHRSGGSPAALGIVLAGGLVFGASATAPAQAAESATTGCAIIGVTDISSLDTGVPLLPGSEVTAITATVTNRTEFPISVTAATRLDDASNAGSFNTTVAFPSGATVVSLEPQATTTVTLTLALPRDAGDGAQGTTVTPVIVLTSSQVS